MQFELSSDRLQFEVDYSRDNQQWVQQLLQNASTINEVRMDGNDLLIDMNVPGKK